jgi:membrane-associated HD superfamily phosphohydrolase
VFENGTLVSSEIQYVLIFLLSAIIGWTLNIMFSFKDRSKQIKLAKWNYLFILLLIVALFTKAVMDIPGFAFAVQRMDSVFGLALLFFIGYLNFRAIMLIKKDDALVKSADRIR